MKVCCRAITSHMQHKLQILKGKMQLCRSVKTATAISRNYPQCSNSASSIPAGLGEDGYGTIAKYLHLQLLQNIPSP